VYLAQVVLITPPFTQLNTPYPATAYLKGFFNTIGVSAYQADLGIEVTLGIFSRKGLTQIFETQPSDSTSDNALLIYQNRQQYCATIDSVITFLQGKDSTLAYRIASGNYLPQAARFNVLKQEDLQHAFGIMGVADKAKYFCTMLLEDLSDYIKECVDVNFGLSRYAERLGRSANQFDELYLALQAPFSIVDEILIEKTERIIQEQQPQLLCLSVPFPGNLFAAFRIAQYVKQRFPNTKVAMGGGFANTELRSLSDARVFEFLDFVTLDDGERPLQQLLKYLNNECDVQELKRTFLLMHGSVTYVNNNACQDIAQAETGTPTYTDLKLNDYISAIEVINPMHSLWSNGRWNKLTMAHGCYWGKCTFCDISLDYIQRYEPIAASVIVDRIESLIKETGNSGFHFVDEAAPPALMKAVAIEIIKRGVQISWWTNIRFEKSFTADLCHLLKHSGCIGVSGGLEVASDRLLQLIKKGVTVAQVAQVNKHFTDAGILVHAYLMYGFPTQTAQETIDSMEMVRQMFEQGILQSAFWHRFAMTAHSPVGMSPAEFSVQALPANQISFANNDVEFIDTKGAKHEIFEEGLRTSLFNYMNGVGLDWPLHKWFQTKVPATSVDKDFIKQTLAAQVALSPKMQQRVLFIGNMPRLEISSKSKKGQTYEQGVLSFTTGANNIALKLDKAQANWLMQLLSRCGQPYGEVVTFQSLVDEFTALFPEDDFELWWYNKIAKFEGKLGIVIA
jgi:hypothetical protein